MKIKRYFMIAGVEHESDNGRYVLYDDVKHLIPDPCEGCDSAPIDCVGAENCERI
jgi:hypothetical protein